MNILMRIRETIQSYKEINQRFKETLLVSRDDLTLSRLIPFYFPEDLQEMGFSAWMFTILFRYRQERSYWLLRRLKRHPDAPKDL